MALVRHLDNDLQWSTLRRVEVDGNEAYVFEDRYGRILSKESAMLIIDKLLLTYGILNFQSETPFNNCK